MKAYNVMIKKFDNRVRVTWENYAYGTYYYNCNNETEAYEYLKKEGWEIVKK